MLTERDVERIAERIAQVEAEKVVQRETVDAFERMDLLENGRPNWRALAAPAHDRKRWSLWWDRAIMASIPIGIGLLMANFWTVLAWIQAILQIRGDKGP